MADKKNEWQEREIGSLWRVNSSKGDFYSGEVKIGGETQRIVIFKNKFKKEGSKEADLRIYKSVPRDND